MEGEGADLMKAVKYPETIFCSECHGHVKMLHCRVLERKSKGKVHVEFDFVCVDCGARASASRDAEYLQYSEREFCQSKGLPDFKPRTKGVGVVYTIYK
jgi:hypothetical protein